jgi:hypothetical protein
MKLQKLRQVSKLTQVVMILISVCEVFSLYLNCGKDSLDWGLLWFLLITIYVVYHAFVTFYDKWFSYFVKYNAYNPVWSYLIGVQQKHRTFKT